MGSGGKTKGKRQAHAAKRFGKRMRSLKNRSKDLDQIQVILEWNELINRMNWN